VKWGIILSVTALAITLILFEWPKLRKLPKKDKLVFLALILVAWTLSMFDLANLPGPTSVVHAMFKPLQTIFE